MAYNDLRDWINALHKAGELKRITVEVDPILEMAEIADRAAKMGKGTAKAGGPALLFENVKGYPGAKVLMNQFGSERRMKLALETDSLDGIADRIRTLMKPEMPTSFMDKLKMLPMLAEVGSFFPKVIAAKDAPCKQVIRRGVDVNLLDIPVLKTWPQDGGRFITLPCVVTRDPKSGKRNVGMYRMQVYDGQTTGMHWQRQKVAAEHMRERLRATTPDACGQCRPDGDYERRDGGCGFARDAECCDADEDSRRPHGGGCGDRDRSGDDLFGDCARAAGC